MAWIQSVDLARPLGSARHLQMNTFDEVAPGQRQTWYSWP
jgi:hypothetical protein